MASLSVVMAHLRGGFDFHRCRPSSDELSFSATGGVACTPSQPVSLRKATLSRGSQRLNPSRKELRPPFPSDNSPVQCQRGQVRRRLSFTRCFLGRMDRGLCGRRQYVERTSVSRRLSRDNRPSEEPSMSRNLVMVCVTVLVILVMNSARAEVITIDGTIKSVDAKKRTITVKTGSKTLTLDVSGKTKIRVEGKDAGLDTLKTGQKVTLAYHDKLETVLTIDAGSSASGEAAQLQVAFRSVEIAIDENGACTLTVDSTKGVSGTPGDQGDVIEAASENKPEIVRLKNGSRRIDYDFTRLKSIEALIPQKLPSKSLKAQIRGQ